MFSSSLPSVRVSDENLVDFLFSNKPTYPEDKPLMIDGLDGRFHSWRTLKQAVFQTAHGLHELGLRKDDVLLVLSPNCLEYPVVVLGVVLLGGIVSTCNPAYTGDEIHHQIKDCRANYIFSDAELVPKLKEVVHGTTVRKIISNGPHLSSEVVQFYSLLNNPGTPPRPLIDPKTTVALLPYSSGTTGLPKGVMLSHNNLVANIVQSETAIPVTHNDIVVSILPMFHIYAICVSINMCVRSGFTSIILPKFDPVHFLECIQKFKASALFVAPPVALFLAKHPLIDRYDLSSLKMLLSAAAPLGVETEDEVAKRLKIQILQGYGMTELSPTAMVRDSKGPGGSCGFLLSNMRAKLVSVGTGELVKNPLDEGELCISGPNVMLGYWNRPDETKNTMDSDGFLKTGDIARRDRNGYYYITDRVKELIKVKGFQVAPAELEALLLSHPAVADVAVVPIKDERAGELPKAYIVLKEAHKNKANELVGELDAFVNSRLASYKRLGRRIQFISAIPKSAAGKILRRILRDNPPPMANL